MVEFMKEPPMNTRNTNAEYADFAERLRENPGEWAPWPKVYHTRAATNSARVRVVKGYAKAFTVGEFEATVRTIGADSFLYVRCIAGMDAGNP